MPSAELPPELRLYTPLTRTAEIVTNDWGRTLEIHDPDGNRIGIRDEATFAGRNRP